MLLVGAGVGCGGEDSLALDGGTRDASDAAVDSAEPIDYDPVALAAIEWLAITPDEVGADVVASLMIYGAQKDEPRALEVAAQLRTRLRPSEVARYPGLLDAALPAFPASTLDGVAASATAPDPSDDLGDDRASRCLEETFTCTFTTECLDFVRLDDRWGYVLTHQAVWLVFANASGCDGGIDLDERRHTFAANLHAEMMADPRPSDLAYERLALLGHLGFGSAILPAWLALVAEAQTPDGCLPLGPGEPCHPHPTAVALWALAGE